MNSLAKGMRAFRRISKGDILQGLWPKSMGFRVNSLAKGMRAFRRISKGDILQDFCPKSMDDSRNMINKTVFKVRKLDQQGSTLLMVIICLAFLAILGSLILSVSMINLRMKQVESKSKENFYSCETALDEITAGLEELTAETIKDTYRDVLEHYVIYEVMAEDVRNVNIQDQVLTNLNATLGSDKAGITDRFKNYLSQPKENFYITINSVTFVKTTIPYSLLFQDVSIRYTRDSYQTSITTDVRITMPSFLFSEGSDTVAYSMKQPFEGYALVADGGIYSQNNTGVNTITGNIYAGKEITVQDTDPVSIDTHKVILNGNYIASRGDITVTDTGILDIGSSIRPVLWANNLRTITTSLYLTGNTTSTRLTINAISVLKDDLTLDGRNSSVSMSGAYVGYTGLHTAEGSAIMINGSGSSLNLSGLTSLILAGRAHVTVEDSILKNSTANPDINIMTGESLAFKSNQRAYLVPGEYLFLDNGTTVTAAMHNPITETDLSSATPEVNITETTDSTKLNYSDYILASPNQYQVAAKQTAAGNLSILRYYYLNFASGKSADTFLTDYMTKKPKVLQVLGKFTLGSVKLPAAENIFSVGNVMYYDSSQPAPIQYLPGKSSDFSDDAAMDDAVAALEFKALKDTSAYRDTVLYDKKVSNLPELYFNMTHFLVPEYSTGVMAEDDPVVASTVLKNGIVQVISELPADYDLNSTGFTYYNTAAALNNTVDPAAKSLVVLDGDAKISANSYFNGFLMAKGNITIAEGATINGIIIAAGSENSTSPGDVTVEKNVKVFGRIIAAGDITLKENCTIDCTGATTFDSDLSVNTFLKNLFDLDGQLLWKLFQNPQVTVNFSPEAATSDMADIKHLVTCENWRKN